MPQGAKCHKLDLDVKVWATNTRDETIFPLFSLHEPGLLLVHARWLLITPAPDCPRSTQQQEYVAYSKSLSIIPAYLAKQKSWQRHPIIRIGAWLDRPPRCGETHIYAN